MPSPQRAREDLVIRQADQAYDVLMEQIRGIFAHEVPSLANADMDAARAAIENVRQADHDMMALLRGADDHD